MLTISFGLGSETVNGELCNCPCLKLKKNPVFGELLPRLSFLYNIPRILPGNGVSSTIAPSSIPALTTSNCIDLPVTFLLNVNKGTSVFCVLILYCSTVAPSITSL